MEWLLYLALAPRGLLCYVGQWEMLGSWSPHSGQECLADTSPGQPTIYQMAGVLYDILFVCWKNVLENSRMTLLSAGHTLACDCAQSVTRVPASLRVFPMITWGSWRSRVKAMDLGAVWTESDPPRSGAGQLVVHPWAEWPSKSRHAGGPLCSTLVGIVGR